jgi:hypothetical protein
LGFFRARLRAYPIDSPCSRFTSTAGRGRGQGPRNGTGSRRRSGSLVSSLVENAEVLPTVNHHVSLTRSPTAERNPPLGVSFIGNVLHLLGFAS